MAPKPVDVTIRGKDQTKGPFDSAAKNIEGFKGKVEALKKPFDLLKTTIAGVGAFMIGDFLRKAVDSAMGAESAWARVETSVENAGISFRNARGELDELFTSIQKTTRYSDDDAADAFSTLLTISGDYAASVKNLSLVSDVAAKKQISMTEAADLVGKVMAGTGARGLKEFGITATSASDGLEKLRAKVHGFAEADAGTLSGRLHQIANAFDNVLEAVGRAITGGNGASGGLGAFAEALNDLGVWIDENSAGIKSMADELGRFVSGLVSIPSELKKLKDDPLWQFFVAKPAKATENLLNRAARAIGAMEPEVKDEWDVSVGHHTRPGWLSPEEERQAAQRDADRRRRARELEEQLKKAGTTPTVDILSGIKPNERKQIGAEDLAVASTRTGPKAGGVSMEGVAAVAAELPKTVDIFAVDLPNALNVSGAAIENLFGNWADSIDEIIQGHESLGGALVKSARMAVGGALQAKGKETLLDAGKAAAEGIWPPNPALLAKAGKLFLIGNAQLAAASLFGGGGGGGGGSGGGGGGPSAASFQQQQNAIGGQGKVTVVFPFRKGFLDLGDPDDLVLLREAMEKLAGNRELEFVFGD